MAPRTGETYCALSQDLNLRMQIQVATIPEGGRFAAASAGEDRLSLRSGTTAGALSQDLNLRVQIQVAKIPERGRFAAASAGKTVSACAQEGGQLGIRGAAPIRRRLEAGPRGAPLHAAQT